MAKGRNCCKINKKPTEKVPVEEVVTEVVEDTIPEAATTTEPIADVAEQQAVATSTETNVGNNAATFEEAKVEVPAPTPESVIVPEVVEQATTSKYSIFRRKAATPEPSEAAADQQVSEKAAKPTILSRVRSMGTSMTPSKIMGYGKTATAAEA